MSYVFLGGMRRGVGECVSSMLFLLFGAIAVGAAIVLRVAGRAPLLTRTRISPWYFFSYTFIPLSSIAFPHMGGALLAARRVEHFRKTMVLCLARVSSGHPGVVANRATSIPSIKTKLEARARRARAPSATLGFAPNRLRGNVKGDDVILRLNVKATRRCGARHCSAPPSWPL